MVTLKDNGLEEVSKPAAGPRTTAFPSRWAVPADGRKSYVHQWSPLKWPRMPPPPRISPTAAGSPDGPQTEDLHLVKLGDISAASLQRRDTADIEKHTTDVAEKAVEVDLCMRCNVQVSNGHGPVATKRKQSRLLGRHRALLDDKDTERTEGNVHSRDALTGRTEQRPPTGKPGLTTKPPLRLAKIRKLPLCPYKEGSFACLLRACR